MRIQGCLTVLDFVIKKLVRATCRKIWHPKMKLVDYNEIEDKFGCRYRRPTAANCDAARGEERMGGL